MKKYFPIDLWSLCTFRSKNFALLSAIALTGTISFTACSSSDEVVKEETNPNFDPDKNEVTTQFVFNVSNGNSSTTRMTAEATQASSSLTTNEFRGIDHSYVMCFNQGSDGLYLSAAAEATKSFDMSRVVAAGTLDNAHSRRVLEMSLPLNTNTMLFYGKAIQDVNTVQGYNTYGHLADYSVTDNLATVNFQLAKRLTTEDKTKFQEVQSLVAAVLSCIMNVNRGTSAVAATDKPTGVETSYGFDLAADYKQNMTWSDYFNEDPTTKNPLSPADGAAARPLEIKLYRVYKELTTVQEAELRNASGYAIIQSVKNLWSIINSVRCATPTNKEEALAKYMAHLIDTELRKYFSFTTLPATGGSVEGVSFPAVSTLIAALASDDYWPGGTKPSVFTHISSENADYLTQFPSQFSLPQGSTHVKFDKTNKTFFYVENYNSSAVGGDQFTVDDYYYPAELCYFGNSPVRVSNTEHVVGDYPASVTLWNTDATTSWPSDWEVTHVQSSTRSVAMKNDINYGTSLLSATVGYSALSLNDNNHAIQKRDYGVDTEQDQVITVDDTSFKLVGIIIGDQWPKVGWNFLPKTTDTEANYRKGYIYDNQITNNGAIPASTTSASSPNYTLVFDNYQDMTVGTAADPTNKQPKVYVALELQNNTGVDFFGKDNLITNGSNFYLIGELDPSTQNGPLLPAYHALPPYDQHQNGDATRTVPRVFIQDHMTTANFKIGANSLKYAYLTVPDLRSSSVTLGLSVDLQWSAGLSFDNITVGGN